MYISPFCGGIRLLELFCMFSFSLFAFPCITSEQFALLVAVLCELCPFSSEFLAWLTSLFPFLLRFHTLGKAFHHYLLPSSQYVLSSDSFQTMQ